jgi:uncharacterized protein (TIGR02145 family)
MKNSTEEGSQGACPDGWHIPADEEWNILSDFLGGDAVAGGKMKLKGEQWWDSPNAEASNESGFSALASGEYDYNHYQLLGQNMVMWSSTETNSNWCKYRYLSFQDGGLHSYNFYKDFRYSVRCIKDQAVQTKELNNTQSYFKIDPNPAKTHLRLSYNALSQSAGIVNIKNVAGREFLSFKDHFYCGSHHSIYNISSLPPGFYIVECFVDNKLELSVKMIKI